MNRAWKLGLVVTAWTLSLTGCFDGSGGTTFPPPGFCQVPPRIVSKSVRPYLGSPDLAFSRLKSHIPRTIGQYSDLGKSVNTTPVSVTLSLNFNNENELDQRLAEMYRPGSPTYHQYLSPDEFRARYAPTLEQVEKVKAYLASEGVSVTSVNENGYLLKALGNMGAFSSLFKTEIHQFVGKEGKSYFAPAYELQVPADIPIKGVHGLQNMTQWRTHAVAAKASPLASGSGPKGGLSPQDIRNAYSLPSSANGAGQTLALMELDGYTASDITQYEQAFSLPAVPLNNIFVDGATGAAGSGAGEVTLDIQLMIAVAPGASRILVYEGPNSAQGVLDTYAKIANDNIAKAVSTSWGASEASNPSSFLQSENMIFKQMAAQGQTIYAAAGDSGAYDDGTNISVDDPASQPYVVAVGGTKLFTTANGAYDHETTWNANNTPSGGGGGGGISTVWTQPSFQNGVVTPASLGSTTMRNVPDVAFDADPSTGYSIFLNGAWNIFGGTSCAAPIWAAFTALVNEQRQANGLTSLGYANPALYQIGQGKDYSLDFSDINDGSTNMHYPAVNGYDDATGWGSFKGQNLFEDLIKNPAAVVPPGTGPSPIQVPVTGC